jgi:GrpB-like predicted nucleotidyltransferase (UPF0157 family)
VPAVPLVEYDPQWPHLFEREAGSIRAALDARVLQLEHVGSTSVPGLIANPRIDVVLVVADTTDEPAYVPALEAAGYELRFREPDWYEHRFFKGPESNAKVHVLPPGCPEIDRMLLFRDHLRKDAADREFYARTKCELAARDWESSQDYADAKTSVVQEILARAADGIRAAG